MPENLPKKLSTILIVVINLILVCLIAGIIGGYYFLRQDQTENIAATPQRERTVRPTPSAVQKPVAPADSSASSLEYLEDELIYGGDAPVYVTLYSHNEDSWKGLVNTKEKYLKYRQGLKERTDLIAEYGFDWDWQSDQPVVGAMIEYEDDPDVVVTTEGKNILEYMEDRGAHFDPHAHTNNYADIAYLMSQLGVTPTGVIGGVIHVECGSEYFDFLRLVSWHDEIRLNDDGFVYGEDFPEAKWQPTVLSDPGMGGHWFDDWSSGVWRPGDGEDFYSDFPTSGIVYLGEGYPHNSNVIGRYQASGAEVFSDNGQYIKELVEKIADKELPTRTESGEKFMYTASIHVRDTIVVGEGDDATNTIEGLRELLEGLQSLVDEEKIIFVDFESAAEIWKDEYDAVPWRVDLSSFSFYDEVNNQAEEYCKK